jgi:hypothetical protein
MTTDEKKSKRKARFIRPPHTIKKKAGSGGFDEQVVVKIQKQLDQPKIDFYPYAKQFFMDFLRELDEASKSKEDFVTAREKILRPLILLKANGGMFQYQLISEVSDIGAQFLDAIDPETANEETYDVLRGLARTLKTILDANLKGDGGKDGFALVQEIDMACRRYMSKYNKTQPPESAETLSSDPLEN